MGAPDSFHLLMNKIICPHSAYAATYLDHIIFYSIDAATYATCVGRPEVHEMGRAASDPGKVCN